MLIPIGGRVKRSKCPGHHYPIGMENPDPSPSPCHRAWGSSLLPPASLGINLSPLLTKAPPLLPSVAPLAPPLSTADTISLPPSLLSLESTAAIELLLVQPSSAWILSTAAAIAAFPPLGTPLLAADPIVGGECLRNGQTQQQ